MKGTEKQIKWASEISETVVAILKAAIEDFGTNYSNDQTTPAIINGLNSRIDAINNAEYAGDIIALFKGVRKTGDVRADASRLFAIYQVSVPANAGQKKILCK